jgi:hypothetical protein
VFDGVALGMKVGADVRNITSPFTAKFESCNSIE